MAKYLLLPRLDRWLGLSAAMVMMGCAGLTYTYAVYSEEMKERLQFSQEQVDDIGAAKEFGGVVGLFSGVFYSLYPPWVTVAIGTLLHLSGYIMVWMTVSGKASPSFWLLCVYSAVGTGGDGWIDTACLMTSLQNFGEHRGTAMGVLKAQLGISGATFVMIYEVLLAPDVNQFLLLMTLLPTLAFLVLASLVRPFPQREEEHSPDIRFKMTFNMIVILSMYLMFSVTVKEYFELQRPFQLVLLGTMLSIMVAMYITPIVRVPFFVKFGKSLAPSNGIDLPRLDKKSSETLKELEEEAEEELLVDTDDNNPALSGILKSPDLTVMDCLFDANFWLIFTVVTVGASTGVTIINNFAQIGKAAQVDNTDIYVGLISIWSCLGRLGSGYGSDHMLRHGFARPICLLITQIVMALCCLLLATGLLSSLFIGSALTGLSYGAYWTLVPAILSEVFGLQNFTILYKLVSLGPPVGSYILSAKLVGFLYDRESESYHQMNPAAGFGDCYGRKCFGFGLLVLSLISVLGACASFLLILGTNKFYQRSKQAL